VWTWRGDCHFVKRRQTNVSFAVGLRRSQSWSRAVDAASSVRLMSDARIRHAPKLERSRRGRVSGGQQPRPCRRPSLVAGVPRTSTTTTTTFGARSSTTLDTSTDRRGARADPGMFYNGGRAEAGAMARGPAAGFGELRAFSGPLSHIYQVWEGALSSPQSPKSFWCNFYAKRCHRWPLSCRCDTELTEVGEY